MPVRSTAICSPNRSPRTTGTPTLSVILPGWTAFTHNDQIYATRIAQAIIEYENNLAVDHSTISTATKVEALSAIALAFQSAGAEQEWLDPAIQAHADFIIARQLPNNLCWLEDSYEIDRFEGGIYYNCADPYIRIDGLQHWVNGAAAYLEYLGNQ